MPSSREPEAKASLYLATSVKPDALAASNPAAPSLRFCCIVDKPSESLPKLLSRMSPTFWYALVTSGKLGTFTASHFRIAIVSTPYYRVI